MKKLKNVSAIMILVLSLALATTPLMAQQQQYPAAPVTNGQPQNQQPVYNDQNQQNGQYNPAPIYNSGQQPVYSGNQPYGSGMVVPENTNISIRTNEGIKATKNDVGKTYSAEIAQDVTGPNGQVLIPAGSPATLKIGNVSSGTMGMGSNEVALGLQSVTVNGRSYTVSTQPVKQSGNRGIGANKRTAVMTGGGALLGTVIGAMAGGGKGAAIGAILGAGGGATAQVLTRGSEVKVPAESVLTFHLDQPVTLQ